MSTVDEAARFFGDLSGFDADAGASEGAGEDAVAVEHGDARIHLGGVSAEQVAEAEGRFEEAREAPLDEDEGDGGYHHRCTECMQNLDLIQSDMPILTGTLKRLRKMVLELKDGYVSREDVGDLVDLTDHVLAAFSASTSNKDMRWVQSLMRLVETIPAARDSHVKRMEALLAKCHDANMTLLASHQRGDGGKEAAEEGEEGAWLASQEALAYMQGAATTQLFTLEHRRAPVARLLVHGCSDATVDAGSAAIHIGQGHALL